MFNGILLVLIILIIAVLAIVVVAWIITNQQSSSRPGKTDVKTQPIVQRFYSKDLKVRAFIVRQNDGRYKVVRQRHSEKVINLRGEIAGWQSTSSQPITDSLASAVEIAQSWVDSAT